MDSVAVHCVHFVLRLTRMNDEREVSQQYVDNEVPFKATQIMLKIGSCAAVVE